jgi:hypothetical protein
MCTDVTNGLAGVKLSGSPRMYGSFRDSVDNVAKKMMTLNVSQPYGPPWPVNRDSFTFFSYLNQQSYMIQ